METIPIHSVGRNILGRWTIIETVAHTLDISYKVNIGNICYRTTSAQKGHAIIGHPIHKHIISNIESKPCMLWPYFNPPILSSSVMTEADNNTKAHRWLGKKKLFRNTISYMFGCQYMMRSSNGNIFCVTGHLCREFTGRRWTPRTKATDAELWCFLWSAPEGTIE